MKNAGLKLEVEIRGLCACGKEIVVQRNIEPDSYHDCLKRNHGDCLMKEGPSFGNAKCRNI